MTDQPKKPYSPRMDPKNALFLPIEDKAKHDAELAKVLAAEPRTAGGVLPFDFDPHQPRDEHGRWRDVRLGTMSVSELIDKVWGMRNAPYGKTLLSGKDDHDRKHYIKTTGGGSITAYNEYGDSTEFHDKEELNDWFNVHVDHGGGDGIAWDAIAAFVQPKPPKVKTRVSSPPDTTSSPVLKTSLEKLTKITSSDPVKTDDISSGQVGIVSKITTKDGTYIRKTNKSWGSAQAKDITDAEELVSELGLRIGARVPPVERVDETTVHIGFVEGLTAAEHQDFSTFDVDNIPDKPSSRMLGLLDLMTLNGDRHEGNWIVNEKDVPPVAYGIDHGLGWAQAQPAESKQIPEDRVIKSWIEYLGTPFVPNFVPYDELFSKGDIQRARSALDAMEPRFNEMGKYRWIGISRRVLDIIEQQIDDTLGQQALT